MMSGMTLVVSEHAGVDESACVVRETGIQSSVAARTRRLEGFRRRGEGGLFPPRPELDTEKG